METLDLRKRERVGVADAFQRLLEDTDDRDQGRDEYESAEDYDLRLVRGDLGDAGCDTRAGADERSRDIELFPGRVIGRRSGPPRRRRGDHWVQSLAIFVAAVAIAAALFALLGWLCQP
jgi:hypothetical protein